MINLKVLGPLILRCPPLQSGGFSHSRCVQVLNTWCNYILCHQNEDDNNYIKYEVGYMLLCGFATHNHLHVHRHKYHRWTICYMFSFLHTYLCFFISSFASLTSLPAIFFFRCSFSYMYVQIRLWHCRSKCAIRLKASFFGPFPDVHFERIFGRWTSASAFVRPPVRDFDLNLPGSVEPWSDPRKSFMP